MNEQATTRNKIIEIMYKIKVRAKFVKFNLSNLKGTNLK